jgi:hypothetical protein
MPSVTQSGNTSHDTACANALRTYQAAEAAAAGNQTTINTAAITYFRAIVSSGLKNNCGVEAAMTALKTLGVTGQ